MRARGELWLLAATALHVGIFAVVRSQQRQPTLAPPFAGREIELMVVTDPTEPVDVPDQASTDAPLAARAGRSAPRVRTPAVGVAGVATAQAPLPDGDAGDGAPATTEDRGRRASGPQSTAPRRRIDLGLSRNGTAWLDPKGYAPRRHVPRIEQHLRDGLAERDRRRGMGRGGPALHPAREAARAAGPRQGRAMVRITIGRGGSARSVALLSAVPGGRRWTDAIRRLRRLLAAKRFRVPSGAAGLELDVVITAKVQLPSGATGKEKPYYVPPLGIGAQFDVADIGAHKRRVIYARIARESVL